ncbi:ATP-binding protein [Actinoallomurus purpureus]|uniref:ATP-binding protein n=1 Tax=Actinoallomurus purpureus TaxID=478114 RepID=UPI00209258E2|nr:ATP-binding protein [Actinoallomurus purpureus]MCO6005137.1 ATP-binding protein [Actinoallomurus purpureus]
MSQPRFVDRLDLAAVVTAVNCSRVFTKLTLAKWGASTILDDAVLITSELVTNAVKATGVMEPNPNWSSLGKLNLVGIRLLGFNASIVIEVWDAAPCTPAAKGEDLEAESGRGLNIIAEIAHRWGFYPTNRGKVVWAELVVPPRSPWLHAAAAEASVQPVLEPTWPIAGQHDPELLKCLMEGHRGPDGNRTRGERTASGRSQTPQPR